MGKVENKKKLLSCKFCKKRKIKCDFEVPCSNCIKFKVQCEPVDKDLRKKKFNNLYVNTLKEKVKRLESFIIELKKTSNSIKRDELLNSFDIIIDYNDDDNDDNFKINHDNLSSPELSNNFEISKDLPKISTNKTEVIIEKIETGQLSVYGKPVIYMPRQLKTIKKLSSTEFQLFHVPVILGYISNFFRWQYMEYNLYIYRESFLTDFFRDRGDVKESLPYCNEELIFAICACGSAIDFNETVFMHKGILYDSSEKFYNRSRYLLFQKLNTDDCNSITAIQTLLCLSFYDLGRGRTLSAWILSGIAFRIGLHMGFELNLQKSHLDSGINNLTDYDLNVRSRIYWGCRLADSFISFVLGRSPTLEYLNATIPKSENLPILQGIEYFLYYDPIEKDSKISNISNPLEQINALYKIVHKYHEKLYGEIPTSSNDDINNNNNGNGKNNNYHVLHYLHNFNLEAYEWKNNLIELLYWTKTELKTKGYNPNQMSFRYQYYLILLSINKDFIDITNESSNSVSPKNVCLNIIEEIYYAITCFNIYHSYKFTTLTMVYLCILSIEILKNLPDNINLPIQRISMIEFFGTILKESSNSWGLAKCAYKSFCDKSQQSEVTVDFSQFNHKYNMRDMDESLIPSLNYP